MQTELLCDHKRATDTLVSLIESCESMSWAVAWATESRVTDAAFDHKSKFEHLLVGTHQCITSPTVLERFRDVFAFRVHAPNGQLFHPKVYCFEMAKESVAVVGSHNLTGSAFTKNKEASIVLRGAPGEQALQDLFAYVKSQWSLATLKLTDEWLYAYKLNHLRSKRVIVGAEDWIDFRRPSGSAEGKAGAQDWSWSDYVARVTMDLHFPVEGRLALLEAAGRLFRSCDSFAKLSEADRRRIAGTRGAPQRHRGCVATLGASVLRSEMARWVATPVAAAGRRKKCAAGICRGS